MRNPIPTLSLAVICLALASCTNSETASKQAALPDLSGEWTFHKAPAPPLKVTLQHIVATGELTGQSKEAEKGNDFYGQVNDQGELRLTHKLDNEGTFFVYTATASSDGRRISGSEDSWFSGKQRPDVSPPGPFVATKN